MKCVTFSLLLTAENGVNVYFIKVLIKMSFCFVLFDIKLKLYIQKVVKTAWYCRMVIDWINLDPFF